MDPALQDLIYLNNAATTWPKPPEVLQEVAQCLRLPLHEPGRTTGNGSMDYPSATREALAALFHAPPPEHFIFTQNATDALNLLIHGFVKKTGAPFHAVTTDLEHNSVLRPLTTLSQEGMITLSVVPFTGTTVSLAAIKEEIRAETRLVVMTQGTCSMFIIFEARAQSCRTSGWGWMKTSKVKPPNIFIPSSDHADVSWNRARSNRRSRNSIR